MGVVAFSLAEDVLDRTAPAVAATAASALVATTWRFVGATSWSAAQFGPFHELAEFNASLVGFRQLFGQIRHFGRRVAEKIKEDLLTIEQLFNVEQLYRHVPFGKQPATIFKGFLLSLP